MKILTIGCSPYLMVRNGKINSDVIKRLVSDGHEVSSAVWHHDEGYFMPSDEGIHSYEEDGKLICQLYPFYPKREDASPFIYELMKVVQPNIVITIGDHRDTNFLFSIKAMYPTLFKWIAIYTIDCQGIPVVNKDAFEYADYVITTNEFSLKEISSFANINGSFIPYGADHYIFNEDCSIKKEYILCSSRNAQASNIAAFVDSVSDLSYKSYIHTNLYDPGDYNIYNLKEKYKAKNLLYTEEYCSIKDGIPNSKICEIYNKSHIIVDCSIKSATGLSLLEGMACGCIPVGPNYGRVGEIILQMPEGLRFFVSYNNFVGQNEEQFAIVSSQHLKSILLSIISDQAILEEGSKAAIEVSKKIDKQMFLNRVSEIVKTAINNQNIIALDAV